jgi:hypothetical protein
MSRWFKTFTLTMLALLAFFTILGLWVWAMMEAVQATFEATGFVPLAILAGIMVFATPLVAIASLNEDR